MKYFKIVFTSDENKEDLYVTAGSLTKVELFVLNNYPFDDYCGMNVFEVWPDKSNKKGGDMLFVPVKECFIEDLGTDDEEELKKIIISQRSKYDCINKEIIKDKLETDDKWLYAGIMAIYKHQTEDEQQSQETKHINGVGFNGADAKIMSSFAEFLMKTGFLTGKQKAIARKKMRKYAGQLEKIALA